MSEEGYGEGLALIGVGVGARLLSTAVVMVTGIVTIALAVRFLGVNDYGVLAFGLSAAGLIGGMTQLGLGAGATRTVASLPPGDRPELERTASAIFTVTAAAGALGALGVVVLLQFAPAGLDRGTRWAVGLWLGALLLGSNISLGASFLARGLRHMFLMEVPSLVVAITRFVIVAGLVVFGVVTLSGVALAYGVAGIFAAAAGERIARALFPGARRLFRLSASEAKKLLVVTGPFALIGFASVAMARFDVLVLGLAGTSAQVGLYEPTLRITDRLMLLVSALAIAAFLPVSTRLFLEQDRRAFRDLFLTVSKLVYVASFPAVLMLAAFPQQLLHALYGHDFPARADLVWILLAGYVVNLAFGVNWVALSASGDRRALTWTALVTLVGTMVFAVALVVPFHEEGAALATTASYVLLNAAVGYELYRTTRVHPFRSDVVWTIVSSAVPFAAALAISYVATLGVWAGAGVALGLWALWAGALVRAGVVRSDEVRGLLARGSKRWLG